MHDVGNPAMDSGLGLDEADFPRVIGGPPGTSAAVSVWHLAGLMRRIPPRGQRTLS